MRILFIAVATPPHVYPLVPLAWACRLAGHEVRFVTAGSVSAVVTQTGLPATKIRSSPVFSAEERDALVRSVYSQPPWPRDYGVNRHLLDSDQRGLLTWLGRYMIEASESLADGLVEFTKVWRPDLVVHDAVTYAGAVAAAVVDVPAVRHLFGSASYPRLELTPPDPLPEYVQLFTRFGVPPTTSAAMIVDPTPPSMRQTAESPRLDMRYIPYNGAGAVPDWAHAPQERPRVLVTWGHTNAESLGGAAADPFSDTMEVAAELGMEVVVLTDTPLQYVLPHCDLIVQQGGDGTTLTAATFGVPQLMISRKPDAELAPARLAAVGAGIHLKYQNLRDDPDSRAVVREAMVKLCEDSSYRDAAARLRAEISAQPSPAEVVAGLEALV
ncbi:nucleotide disphospho-sugar-binding domain-containing protein [Actinocrispum wychmicini]|uniref:Glycosyltransferase n=1 Tax=Actinocrispum wychmicini TaxID=1213861 RepID=A0A4R2IP36_9PSEU|nr:nucleotide disphospho-sugar-binding domain-containing protein [Actinocrispum wychmicini]TCO46627.1 glycosyltransferase [Actinocrispum wychmicini]